MTRRLLPEHGPEVFGQEGCAATTDDDIAAAGRLEPSVRRVRCALAFGELEFFSRRRPVRVSPFRRRR